MERRIFACCTTDRESEGRHKRMMWSFDPLLLLLLLIFFSTEITHYSHSCCHLISSESKRLYLTSSSLCLLVQQRKKKNQPEKASRPLPNFIPFFPLFNFFFCPQLKERCNCSPDIFTSCLCLYGLYTICVLYDSCTWLVMNNWCIVWPQKESPPSRFHALMGSGASILHD